MNPTTHVSVCMCIRESVPIIYHCVCISSMNGASFLHSTFSSSEDKAKSLTLSLLQHSRLLLDHIVAKRQKTQTALPQCFQMKEDDCRSNTERLFSTDSGGRTSQTLL